MVIVLFLSPSWCKASVRVLPHERVYDVLERLSTAGLASRSLMVGSLPEEKIWSVLSVLQEDQGNPRWGHRLGEDLIRELGQDEGGRRAGISRRGYLRLRIEGLRSGRNRLKNMDVYERFDFSEGNNFGVGVVGGLEVGGRVSVYGEGYLLRDQEKVQGYVRELYLDGEVLGMTLGIGRTRMWGGPGYHGDFVLTDNASGFTSVRAERRVGSFWGGLSLGEVQGPKSAGRALFNGLHVNWFCAEQLGVGLSIGIVFRSARDWLEGLKGGDPSKRAGRVVEMSGVFYPADGVKIYGVTAGYGSIKGLIPRVKGNAYLMGLYLSDPLGDGKTDFRCELARFRREQEGYDWYFDGPSYVHRSWVLGHHVGRPWGVRAAGERDLFLRTTHRPFRNTVVGFQAHLEGAKGVERLPFSTLLEPEPTIDTDVYASDVTLEIVQEISVRWDLSVGFKYTGFLSMVRKTGATWKDRRDAIFRAGVRYRVW